MEISFMTMIVYNMACTLYMLQKILQNKSLNKEKKNYHHKKKPFKLKLKGLPI